VSLKKFAEKVPNLVHLRDTPTSIEGYVANVGGERNNSGKESSISEGRKFIGDSLL
jgi:hypothetical protein